MSGVQSPVAVSGRNTPRQTSGRDTPRVMGWVSPISDAHVKDTYQKDQTLLQTAVHYLKNSVTLESKEDRIQRESWVTDRAHVNNHGGSLAEAQFWQKHSKNGGKGSPKNVSTVAVHEVKA